MRAFARDTGISPTSLSLVFAEKSGLSAKVAKRISRIFDWDEEQRERFCDLVASRHSRSPTEKRAAKLRLNRFDSEAKSLTAESFRVVSEWYHFAIMELTGLKGFKNSATWISSKLGVTEDEARGAIERMKRLSILEEVDGTLRKVSELVLLPSGKPNDDGRRFHLEILKRAMKSLEKDDLEKRDFSSIVMKVRTRDLGEAKRRVKAFRRTLMNDLENGQDHDDVACLSIQLFSLTL